MIQAATTLTHSAFDLAIQQGGIGSAATMAAYKSDAASRTFDTQSAAMEFLFKYKAERAKKAFRADCLSRRMGVLTAQAYQATLAGVTANRQNKNYELLRQTGNLSIQE